MSDRNYTTSRVGPGLVKRSYKDGSVRFRSTVYQNGAEQCETLAVNCTLAQAKALHRKRQDEVGGAVFGKTFLDAKVAAFAHLDLLVERGEASKTTVDHYKDHWRLRLEQHPISRMRLDQIDDVVALNFLRDLKGMRSLRKPFGLLAGHSQNAILSPVRTILRYAREQRWMKYDPFAGIASREFPPQKPAKETRALSPEEVALMIETVISDEYIERSDTLYSNAVLVLLGAGQRASEALGNRWGDVDLVDCVLHTRVQQGPRRKLADPVELKKLKVGEQRSQSMLPIVEAALLRQLEHEQSKGLGNEGDFLYTSATGIPIDRNTLYRAVMRCAKLAGISPAGSHALRRSFCTGLAIAGVPSMQAATITGHSPAIFDRLYAKPQRTLQAKRAAMDQLASTGYAAGNLTRT